MNKYEFLEALKNGLHGVAPDEQAAALQYYSEYLDDAGPEREAEVIAELGSPEKLAEEIRAESVENGWVPPEKSAAPKVSQPAEEPAPSASTVPPYGQEPVCAPPAPQRDNSKLILIIILAVLFSPLIFGLLGTVFGVLVSVAVVLAVPIFVGLIMAIVGIICVPLSVSVLVVTPPDGFLMLGISLLVLGLGLLCLYAGIWIWGKLIPAAIRGMKALYKKIRNRI